MSGAEVILYGLAWIVGSFLLALALGATLFARATEGFDPETEY